MITRRTFLKIGSALALVPAVLMTSIVKSEAKSLSKLALTLKIAKENGMIICPYGKNKKEKIYLALQELDIECIEVICEMLDSYDIKGLPVLKDGVVTMISPSYYHDDSVLYFSNIYNSMSSSDLFWQIFKHSRPGKLYIVDSFRSLMANRVVFVDVDKIEGV